MKIFYFTATGNSLAVGRRIGGELFSIPAVLRQDQRFFKDNDAIGIVFPTFYFGLPATVDTFLREAVLETPYLFAVMTYGNIDGGCLNALRRAGARVGTRFDYTARVKMVDNYLPLFDIADQLRKEPSKDIEGQLTRITDAIARRQKGHMPNALWARVASRFSVISYRRAMRKAPKQFRVDDSCNACGTCARVCSRGNVAVTERPAWGSDCELCYACIHVCPKTAIHLKGEKSPVRFRNREISVKDLVDAAGQ